MRRVMVVVWVLAVILVVYGSVAMAAEEGKEGKKAAVAEKKMKGDLIPHPETGDVKVLTESYETETITVTDKTRIEATVRGKLEDMGAEAEYNLPKGEVTYIIVDGKPVATRITYTSRETWKQEPPKPPAD